MNIVFVSNYFNHHQRQLSDALDRLTGGKYYFVATACMSEERRKLGYGENSVPEYVQYIYNSDARERCQQLIDEADVVIAGSAPEYIIRNRIKNGKLVFRYAERPLKHGIEPLKYLLRLVRWHMCNPMNKPIYMLCASAYTAVDYRKFGLFRNRTYKWGYFPETRKYDNVEELISKKSKTTILWCGRFIDWKHPDDAMYVARRLKEDGYDFRFEFVGCGDMEPVLLKMAINYNLDNYIYFRGSMKPDQVRNCMEKSGIYLFTSDQNEGWGAVLNESMNSACAVVASNVIGAVPFMVKDGENGLVYESGNVDMLYEKVRYLIDNQSEQERLGAAAYKTIADEWNAEIAAERFLNLSEHILAGEKYPDLYASGPCSKAEVVKEGWFKG